MRKVFEIRSDDKIVATITIEAANVTLGGEYPGDHFIRAFDADQRLVFSAAHRPKVGKFTHTIAERKGYSGA